MAVDVAQTAAEERMVLDEPKHLFIGSPLSQWQAPEFLDDLVSWSQVADGQFSDDERVREHLLLMEQGLQGIVALSKVVDPHRCIDQGH